MLAQRHPRNDMARDKAPYVSESYHSQSELAMKPSADHLGMWKYDQNQ